MHIICALHGNSIRFLELKNSYLSDVATKSTNAHLKVLISALYLNKNHWPLAVHSHRRLLYKRHFNALSFGKL